MKDRLPPYDEAAEMAVIGCCLNDPANSIPETGMVATSSDIFYDIRCREAWETMVAMEARKVNIITLVGQMKMEKSQSVAFLNECQDAAFSSANLSVWLETIQGKFTLRKIIKTAQAATQSAFGGGDPTDMLESFERDVMKIRPAQHERKDIRGLLGEAQKLIEFRSQNWDAVIGLTTGIPDLDKLTDGLHPSEFIVIAAMPSCGKTALAVNMAITNAIAGIPVGIISAEMRPVQLVIRSICSESRVNFKRMSDPDIYKMIPVIEKMSRAPIHIEQASGWTIGQVIASARRLKQRHGIGLLVVDYIQKLAGVGDNREQKVASVGSGLKDIAMELDIPVVGLSQLNDDGKLRDSRAIGQDGDSIWKLANDGEWKSDIQPVKLRVEKCRDGETGEVNLTFFKTFTRFEQAEKFPEHATRSQTND